MSSSSEPPPRTFERSNDGKMGLFPTCPSLSGSHLTNPCRRPLSCRSGNLELWTYIERPDFFAAIGASDDEFERFLACLRWLLTRDLRTVKHPIAKPFNSIL